METDYIVDATNRIEHILSETVEPNQAHLEKVFSIACHTLTRASAQADVLDDLRRLAITQKQFWAEYQEIVGNVDHFVRGFCVIEERAMIAAGLSENAAESLVQQAITLRDSIKSLTINPHQVRDDIKKLSDTSCDVARKIHEHPIQQDERRKMKKQLKRFFAGIGGIAIVGINASALAATIGLSAAGTAVSAGVGSGLIGAALVIE
jgi:hypothetical protein